VTGFTFQGTGSSFFRRETFCIERLETSSFPYLSRLAATSRIIYGESNLMANDDFVSSAKTLGPRLPAADPLEVLPQPAPPPGWKQQAQRLQTEAHVFYFAFQHPRVRWYARLIAAGTAVYLFCPVQLIPSFIPVIGFLDDFLILFLGVKLLRRLIPADVLAECRVLAEAAEVRRKEAIRSAASTVGFVAVVSFWLVAAVVSSALMLKYIRR
jgi:uncharacterized membrane protein YkvA (DUF1232 family)